MPSKVAVARRSLYASNSEVISLAFSRSPQFLTDTNTFTPAGRFISTFNRVPVHPSVPRPWRSAARGEKCVWLKAGEPQDSQRLAVCREGLHKEVADLAPHGGPVRFDDRKSLARVLRAR